MNKKYTAACAIMYIWQPSRTSNHVPAFTAEKVWDCILPFIQSSWLYAKVKRLWQLLGSIEWLALCGVDALFRVAFVPVQALPNLPKAWRRTRWYSRVSPERTEQRTEIYFSHFNLFMLPTSPPSLSLSLSISLSLYTPYE